MRNRRLLLLLALSPWVALAQPQGRLLWSHPGTDGIYSTVAIGDVDGDSVAEVVGAIYYGGTPSDPRKVYCLSGATGDTLWVSRTAYGTWGNKGLARSADLSGDGHDDIILGTAGTYIPPGRSCIAIDGVSGGNLWVFPFGQQRWWCYAVAAFVAPDGRPVDLDGDSVPEVLAGAGGVTNDRRGTAIALSGRTGDSLWAFRPDFDGVQSLAPFTDINGDTVPEVLVAAGGNGLDNRAFCVSGRDGSVLWACTTSSSISDIVRIADVNRSGTDDCIAGGWADSVFCIEGATGALIWAAGIGIYTVMELVPIRDTDDDGVDDVVVGSWDSNVYVLSGADGSLLWGQVVGADVWAVDTLADLTADGIPEVVAGCLGGGSGVVKLFDGSDGNTLWQCNFSERVYDVTGIPDIDRDGQADVAVGLQDHGNQADHLLALSGQPPSALAGGAGPATPDLRLAYDARARALRFDGPPRASYRLSVHDAAGRVAGQLDGTGCPTGPTVVPLTRFDRLPSGSLFATLRLEDRRTAALKFILAKGHQR